MDVIAPECGSPQVLTSPPIKSSSAIRIEDGSPANILGTDMRRRLKAPSVAPEIIKTVPSFRLCEVNAVSLMVLGKDASKFMDALLTELFPTYSVVMLYILSWDSCA